MNSSTPEKSTMASNLRAISARGMPMIAPCRKTFSRPVRSGWKPAATSISAPTRPRTSSRPRVGRRILVSSLSTVDLPAPFGPMMPSASPGLTVNDMSRTAQNSCSASACSSRRRTSRATIAGTRSRRLSWRSPRRNFFQTPSKTTELMSEVLRKIEFRRVEHHPREHEQHHARRRGDRERGVRSAAFEENGAERVNQVGHRIQREHGAEPPTDAADGINDRGGEHPDGDDDLEQVLDVAVKEIAHRHEQRHGGREDDVDEDDRRQQQERPADGDAVIRHQRGEDEERDAQIDERDQHRQKREDLAREVDLRHQARIAGQRD